MRNVSVQDERGPGLLFTAFEPSGDDHASAVIAELRRRHPNLPMYAWGGPKMEKAGATLIERTGDDAVMGVPGIQKIIEHKRINDRIAEWIKTAPVSIHIPVDSPAANTPICEITKAAGLHVVHLVAPQIWAWGRWRIHKLRRLTDLVLCMLPFEPAFFEKRRVPARYIGHFLFDEPVDADALDAKSKHFPTGHPRLALMPGSRPDELERHFPVLLEVFRLIKANRPDCVGVVAATSDRVAELLKKMAAANGGWPDGLEIVSHETDAVVRWCDLALVKSGTVTLQVAKQRRPMVVFYKKSNPVVYLFAKTMLATKVFSLPNVLAHRRIVPEFVPHFGGPAAIVRAAERLLADPGEVQRQLEAVDSVLSQFQGMHAASLAADAIETFISQGAVSQTG